MNRGKRITIIESSNFISNNQATDIQKWNSNNILLHWTDDTF